MTSGSRSSEGPPRACSASSSDALPTAQAGSVASTVTEPLRHPLLPVAARRMSRARDRLAKPIPRNSAVRPKSVSGSGICSSPFVKGLSSPSAIGHCWPSLWASSLCCRWPEATEDDANHSALGLHRHRVYMAKRLQQGGTAMATLENHRRTQLCLIRHPILRVQRRWRAAFGLSALTCQLTEGGGAAMGSSFRSRSFPRRRIVPVRAGDRSIAD
jgi:hypothetical protein